MTQQEPAGTEAGKMSSNDENVAGGRASWGRQPHLTGPPLFGGVCMYDTTHDMFGILRTVLWSFPLHFRREWYITDAYAARFSHAYVCTWYQVLYIYTGIFFICRALEFGGLALHGKTTTHTGLTSRPRG